MAAEPVMLAYRAGTDPFFAVVLSFDRRRPMLAVRGELDLATAPILEQALDGVVANADPVVVDLARLGFADVAGCRPLLAAAERLAQRGQRITIRRPSPMVRKVLELTRFAEVFDVEA